MIHQISREDDPQLQVYRHVGEPRWLQAHGLFVAEGRLVVERLLAHGGYAIESVLVTPTAFRALEPGLRAVHAVYVAQQPILDGVTGFKFHRGCLAIVRRPPDRAVTQFGAARRLVVLEGIGNPDNIGGIFRSAAALGAEGVVLDPTCADPLYRKAVRTSMGAALRMPFSRVEAWPSTLGTLRQMGFAVIGLTPAGILTVDECAATLAPDTRVALVAGGEGPGLTAGAMAAVDTAVRIPVEPRSDSLNVVVAVSIALERLRVR